MIVVLPAFLRADNCNSKSKKRLTMTLPQVYTACKYWTQSVWMILT